MSEDIKQIEELAKKMADLKNYEGEDNIISCLDYIDAQGKDADVPRFYSKLPKLNELVKGFVEGSLTVISGPTGHGKTSFAQSLTEDFFENEVASLWFSYEVQPMRLIKKFPTLPLFYLPAKLQERTLPWLKDRIMEAQLKYNVKAVFIDHMHYLVDMVQLRQPSIEIGSIVRNLRLIAIELGVAIFLLTHLTKTKIDEEIGSEHLRDSSFLAQEPDNLLFIWRLKEKNGEYQNKAILKIDKARDTGVMGKKIPLIYQNNHFKELDTTYD